MKRILVIVGLGLLGLLLLFPFGAIGLSAIDLSGAISAALERATAPTSFADIVEYPGEELQARLAGFENEQLELNRKLAVTETDQERTRWQQELAGLQEDNEEMKSELARRASVVFVLKRYFRLIAGAAIGLLVLVIALSGLRRKAPSFAAASDEGSPPPPDQLPLEEFRAEIDAVLRNDPGDTNRVVDRIIVRAVRWRSSDIHIGREAKSVVVHYRIDGKLYRVLNLPLAQELAVINVIKVMANMKIFERRVPQDGQILFRGEGLATDLRVSVTPSHDSEKVVLRVFDTSGLRYELLELGLAEHTLERFKAMLARRQGTVLLCGPAGSGKTTTIYSALTYIKEKSQGTVNIVSVEDPVEHQMDGVTQIEINRDQGMTYDKVLISILRQDPEVIVIGEIRDSETAKLAIQAGQTGHLVISTVHAPSPAGVFERLLELGVEPFVLYASVQGVISQRLVQRSCMACLGPSRPSEPLRNWIHGLLAVRGKQLSEGTEWLAGHGCQACGMAGYRGRLVLDELLEMTDETRSQVLAAHGDRARQFALLQAAVTQTMVEDGAEKAQRGLTTLEELRRVLA